MRATRTLLEKNNVCIVCTVAPCQALFSYHTTGHPLFSHCIHIGNEEIESCLTYKSVSQHDALLCCGLGSIVE